MYGHPGRPMCVLDDREPVKELREAAAAVGFRFLDRHLSSREAAAGQLGTFEGHDEWLRALVAEIDRDSRTR